MKHVFYITRYSCDPAHPRVTAAWRVLDDLGFKVEVAATSGRGGALDRLFNYLTLTFFNPWSCLRHARAIWRSGMVYILGIRELPVAVVAWLLGKPVVYETLDHDPVHEGYRLVTSRRLPKRIIGRIPGLVAAVTKIEEALVRLFVTAVVVNSRALRDRFQPKSHLAYYYSPFERVECNKDPSKPVAILYLGLFEKDKGAVETIDLAERQRVPLFVFGEVPEEDVLARLDTTDRAQRKPRLSSAKLLQELEALAGRYYLVGTSLIKAVHESYRTQEANKEVDYICMGIPFVGNRRETTYQKIESGCGVYADDSDGLKQLFGDASFRAERREACLALYARVYASSNYAAVMRSVLNLRFGFDGDAS